MNNRAFIPGLLVGAALGIVGTGALWYFGPKPIENARLVERCTVAYVQSHGGMLPKGTLVQGEGREVIVVGYDAAAK
ncbi:hypothetical protein EA560_21840 [Salmonella enterica]|nr:hypothetical protein [Salmonella enterica]EAS6882759.1 hypothetical protein [Salmonella enterica subsp. enterica serovar Pomona]EFH7880011.1 hypothetical protein [Escherichia coli]EBA1194376.1 hypothetical protein [Salmonella enterica]EFJ2256942.1 hypothetical protein [Escherichia coli]